MVAIGDRGSVSHSCAVLNANPVFVYPFGIYDDRESTRNDRLGARSDVSCSEYRLDMVGKRVAFREAGVDV